MKNLLILLVSLIGLSASSQDKKNKNAKYEIEVNGNCEQCKKRIEKAAYSVSGVKSADWNIESHKMAVLLNEEKTSILDVQRAIAKAGHDTEEVKATDADYNNLHSCCLYERK